MREVGILGTGMHPWGKFPEKSYVELGVYACQMALKDAGIKWTDIEAIASGSYFWGGMAGLHAGHQLAAAMGETGIPIVNVANACATATSALRQGWMMVASGLYDIVLVVGLDKSPKGFFPGLSEQPDDVEFLRWRMVGASNPAYWAMECRRRMEEFGTTEEDLARIKVKASKVGSLNPNARYRKNFTLEEVMNSPMVCYPLRLYEICATSDGAAAVILASMKKVRQHTTKVIKLAAASLASPQFGDASIRLPLLSFPSEAKAPHLSESAMAAKKAYEQAGIGPEDLDLIELPDNSSWHELAYMEIIGICKEGEAEGLLRDGETELGGRIPVCPSGGANSFGEAIAAQGLLQVCENVLQLRGEAGARQVKDAKVAYSQVYGMLGNNSAAIVVR